jgi:hypothetical protein
MAAVLSAQFLWPSPVGGDAGPGRRSKAGIAGNTVRVIDVPQGVCVGGGGGGGGALGRGLRLRPILLKYLQSFERLVSHRDDERRPH